VRIENLSGSRTRLDCLYFDELPGSGVEDRDMGTWGRIKAMWK
jgi:hypothetical protein